MSSSLGIWMNGEIVGTWTVDRGVHRLSYDKTWLESPKRRSLSLSLPITASLEISGAVVANYFDNLLPDSENIRKRIARRYKTGSLETFHLLQAIGRDCVGAVQLLPEGRDASEGLPGFNVGSNFQRDQETGGALPWRTRLLGVALAVTAGAETLA